MTERKRATGFVLMDAAFTADAKFVRLARMADDPVDFAASVGVWWMLLADCRRAKSPVVDWDDYTEYAEQIAKLRAARLLDEHGFEQESFDRWAPAYRSVPERTRPYPGNERGRKGTEGTNTSGQVRSSHGEGGVGGEAGIWNGEGVHDGRHGYSCSVCEVVLPPRPQVIEGGKGA